MDQDLLAPGAIHKTKCRAAPVDAHIPSMQRCTCGSAQYFYRPGMLTEIIEMTEKSCLLRPMNEAMFWTERRTLMVAEPPPDSTLDSTPRIKLHQRLPMDYITIETALGGREPLKYPRRRKNPSIGEIVFIRSEMKDRMKPYRFLAMVYEDGKKSALLVEPGLSPDFILSLVWGQQTTVCLETDKGFTPDLVLFPCFPLPDGTKNPGWS